MSLGIPLVVLFRFRLVLTVLDVAVRVLFLCRFAVMLAGWWIIIRRLRRRLCLLWRCGLRGRAGCGLVLSWCRCLLGLVGLRLCCLLLLVLWLLIWLCVIRLFLLDWVLVDSSRRFLLLVDHFDGAIASDETSDGACVDSVECTVLAFSVDSKVCVVCTLDFSDVEVVSC